MDGEFAQCLAVEEHFLLFRSADKPAVHHSLAAERRVQTGNPETAEFALLVLAVAVRVLTRFHGSLRRQFDRVAAPAAEPLRYFEELGMSVPGTNSSLDAHDLEVREKANEGFLLLKILGFKGARKLSLPPAFLHEEMTPAVTLHHNFSGTGPADPLLRAAVGLNLHKPGHRRGKICGRKDIPHENTINT